MSKERIKGEDDHNIRWQKPMKLMGRLLAPFTKEGDLILDPFMGSGTTGEWCIRNNRNFIGIEYDPTVFKIAEKRLSEIKKDACI
jgi:DNA modification methylase